MGLYTAQLAVDAIAGRPRPRELAPPLPRALLEWAAHRRAAAPGFAAIADLVPVVIRSWTRTTVPLLRELPAGQPVARAPAAIDRYQLRRRGRSHAPRLLALCDGARTVRGIAAALGIRRADNWRRCARRSTRCGPGTR